MHRIAAVSVAVLFALGPGHGSPAQAADSKPQSTVAMEADSSVEFGTLPNGMRVAVMRNAVPPASTVLALRVGVGSLHESDTERGLAHFLEHMAYNGSRHFENGATKALDQAGIRFRALTDFDKSTYTLTVPSADSDALSLALTFLADIADGLTLKQSAIDLEKGTILSELRLRGTPRNVARDLLWSTVQHGMRAGRRIQGGDERIIRRATRSQLLSFYRRYYRPERAMLVAVGDFDVPQFQGLVAKSFGAWVQPGSAGRDPDLGTPRKWPRVVRTFTHGDVSDEVTVAWTFPPIAKSDSFVRRRAAYVRDVALSVLNRRFARQAAQAGSPFLAARVSLSEASFAGTTAYLVITPRKGKTVAAVDGALADLERAMRYPLFASEIDRARKLVRNRLYGAMAAAGARSSAELAASVLSGMSEAKTFTTPATELELFDVSLSETDPKEYGEALTALFAGPTTVVFLVSKEAVSVKQRHALKARASNSLVDVSRPAEPLPPKFAYVGGAETAQLASQSYNATLGASLLEYSNNVLLNVKTTDVAKGRVDFTLRIRGGIGSIPKQPPALGAAARDLLMLATESDDLAGALAGEGATYRIDFSDDALVFTGRALKGGAESLAQVFTTLLREAVFDEEALSRAKEWFARQGDESLTDPVELLNSRLPALVRGGDSRWARPSATEYASVGIREVQEYLRSTLQQAPLEVTIVGDIEIGEAKAMFSRTFGVLAPRRSARHTNSEPAAGFRYPTHARTICWPHVGRSDQAVVGIVWPLPSLLPDTRLARTAQLMSATVRRAAFDRIVKQGISYRAIGTDYQATTASDFGFLPMFFEVRPADADTAINALDGITSEIRLGTIDNEIIERARRAILDSRKQARSAPSFWSFALQRAQSEPETVAALETELSDIGTIRRSEIVEAAARLMRPDIRLEVRIVPGRCP